MDPNLKILLTIGICNLGDEGIDIPAETIHFLTSITDPVAILTVLGPNPKYNAGIANTFINTQGF